MTTTAVQQPDVKEKILKLLEYFEPFKQCAPDVKDFVATNAQLVRGTIGQTLLRAEGKANYVYLLVEGRVRVVGEDSRTAEIETIELCNPGSCIGWVAVLRGRSCETALCSSDVITVRLEKEVISTVFAKSKEARIYWSSHAAKAELFEATSTILKQHPDCKLSTFDLIEKCKSGFRICVANQTNAEALAQEDFLWYVSGGNKHGQVTSQIASLFEEKKSYRVIGLKTQALRAALSGEVVEDTDSTVVSLFDQIRELDESSLSVIEDDFEPEYVEKEDDLKVVYRKGKGAI
jgi:ATP-binding cassette subfamily B protein